MLRFVISVISPALIASNPSFHASIFKTKVEWIRFGRYCMVIISPCFSICLECSSFDDSTLRLSV